MPVELYEDALDLQIGLIEASLPTSARELGYPYPRLRPTGEEEMRRFRSIVMENEHLRATWLPGMGGRLISLFDKRTGVEILRRGPALVPREGGRTGSIIDEGVQILAGDEPRLNALGPVDSLLVPGEEDGPGVLWLAETSAGSPVGWHALWVMHPGRAELLVELRAQNRSWRTVHASVGLGAFLGPSVLGYREDGVAAASDRGVGLAILWPDQAMDPAGWTEGTLRAGRTQPLGPRQTETLKFSLVPFTGFERVQAFGQEGALSFDGAKVRVQVTERRAAHKLLLVTADGRTLEAPADLHPEHALEIPLDGLPSAPTRVILRDPAKDDLLDTADETAAPAAAPMPSWAEGWDADGSDAALRRSTGHPAFRAVALQRLGQRAMAADRWELACELLEQSLLYQGDDPLAWWLKAMAERMRDPESEGERPELLNAHFLAPLEPCLRAEAVLGQPPVAGSDPHPLLAAMTETPEALVEVACHLIDAGRPMEAGRWIEEALRVRNFAMLHVLQADLLLRSSRMEAEAARHLKLAAAAELPPFPYRDLEWAAVGRLRAAGHPLEFLPEQP